MGLLFTYKTSVLPPPLSFDRIITAYSRSNLYINNLPADCPYKSDKFVT